MVFSKIPYILLLQASISETLFSDITSVEGNTNDETIEQRIALQMQEREAELIARKLGVLSETGQGVRCSIRSCRKLFRKEKLLRQHVKHYHPKEYKEVINSSRLHLDHENDMIKRSYSLNNDRQQMDSKKRKLSGHQSDVYQDYNKRVKRLPQHLVDEDELEIDSPNYMSHIPSLINNMVRHRNDSLLSVSSGFSDGDVFSDKLTSHSQEATPSTGNLTKQKGRLNPATPSTPPTFRLSKRRQAQLRANRRNDLHTSPRETSEFRTSRAARTLEDSILKNSMSPKVALTILDDSMLASPTQRLMDQQQLSPATGSPQAPSTSAAVNLSGQSSYPPSEMDVLSVTGSEHLTTEELVNCTCRRVEEDGLMIQCDICLCWQHGSCLAIEEEDQVPEYYVCETCRHPRLGRTSAKYSVDQDWLNKGILPNAVPLPLSKEGESAKKVNMTIPSSCAETSKQSSMEKEAAFRKLSELMADLANLSKILHSLRVKLHVASQSNNSKVFMWSSIWDSPASSMMSELKQEVPVNNGSQQLFNTGGILNSVEDPGVNLPQGDLPPDLNLIHSTSSISLPSSMTQRLDPQLSELKLDPKMAAAEELHNGDTASLRPSTSEHMTKDVSGESDKFLSFPAPVENPSTNLIQSSRDEPGIIRSSISPCPEKNNTLATEPHTHSSLTNNHSETKETSAPNVVAEGKNNANFNGQGDEQLSPSVCNQLNDSTVTNSAKMSKKDIENEKSSEDQNSKPDSNTKNDLANQNEINLETPYYK